jgi:hypothetical protein
LMAVCSAFAATCAACSVAAACRAACKEGIPLIGAPDKFGMELERRASASTVRVVKVTTTNAVSATEEQAASRQTPSGSFNLSLRDFHFISIHPFYQLDINKLDAICESAMGVLIEKKRVPCTLPISF